MGQTGEESEMKALRLGIVVCVLAVAAVSCGRKSPALSPGTGAGKVTKADVPLPEWAPENPSPEFLRAAKVLKPAVQATLARFRRTWTAGYEFFGAMTDEQIDRFVSTKEVRIPVRSLTAKQRAALDNYLNVWREAMSGTGLGADDLLVILYKDGAREDLSNVGVGFVWGGTEQDPSVNLQFWITRPDGGVSTDSNSVAMM